MTRTQYDAVIEMDHAAELSTLRAEVERLREALEEIAKDPRHGSVCIGDGWDFYTDVLNYAKEALE